MTIQHGGRGGKSRNGLRPVHGPGDEVDSLTDIPGPIAESLRHQFSEEIVALFRRANVSPALIYAFLKTGLVATEEDRGHEDCPRDLAHVLSDRLPELFFQTLDQNWELVHSRVRSHRSKCAGP